MACVQTWLAHGPCDVIIPFASKLAEPIPAMAVRLRRDFQTLLSLIKAHALLHQVNRGMIIATIDDYRAIRELMWPIIAESAEALVRKPIKETVYAVEDLLENINPRTTASLGRLWKEPTVSVAALAKHLKLDISAALRRLRAAIALGNLRDLETRNKPPGRSAKIILGDPLPDCPMPIFERCHKSLETMENLATLFPATLDASVSGRR
jgi:hypothetical protein